MRELPHVSTKGRKDLNDLDGGVYEMHTVETQSAGIGIHQLRVAAFKNLAVSIPRLLKMWGA